MKKGEVSKVDGRDAWFMATRDDYGVCIYSRSHLFDRNPAVTRLWMLAGMSVVPPEKWPPRICAAVAKERLTHAD